MIGFYSPREQPYGVFSNFASAQFVHDGVIWRTSEHYYQARKFYHLPEQYQAIIDAKTPKLAASLGRSKHYPIRPNWERVKVDVMKRAVLEKFSQNQRLAALLIDTGNAEIVELSPTDSYWGAGRDGRGQNMLGVVLMQLRSYLVDTRAFISLSRVVHCKRQSFDIYIGRPSKWGNPFKLERETDRALVLAQYREWLMKQPELLAELPGLRGKVLGCWCAPRACHGDVLAELANGIEE